MTTTQPLQTLKGFRDFLPPAKRNRDFVSTRIKSAFELCGFAPFETPTLEYAQVLTGKYGEEADKLLYLFEDRGGRRVGLRYDQTVPTARALNQYRNELPKFFRRYQIQNVFRADKPQRGRFREFTQCDCDIFGSTSSLADAEILAVFYQAFKSLGVNDLVIECNDRQNLVNTLESFATENVSVLSIIQSIDKLDKQTSQEVCAELVTKGLSPDRANQALQAVMNAQAPDNLAAIFQYAQSLGVPSTVLKYNPALARGLDYYTGLIFEGKITSYPVGSVGGGGRYDNLIESLGGPSTPAVGFGIGFDRVVEAVEALGLLSAEKKSVQVAGCALDEDSVVYLLQQVALLRQSGVCIEVLPAIERPVKQFKTAEAKGCGFLIIVGSNEVQDGTLNLKNLITGEQQVVSLEECVKILR